LRALLPAPVQTPLNNYDRCEYQEILIHQTSSPLIRRAVALDAGLLAELGTRTFYESFAADNTAENMAAYLAESFGPDKQAAELADTQVVYLIVEIDGAAVGYAQLRSGEFPACVTGPKPVELVRIYVLQSWLGLGVGQALMRACLDEAQRAGHQTIWLGVWKPNKRALAFYHKWNFSVVGEHIFQLGSDPQEDWIMQRPLP
jgi:ribosomal protein S18 acetylase RimI-like enzyme